MKQKYRVIAIAAALLAAACAVLLIGGGRNGSPPEGVIVWLDGQEMTESTVSPGKGDGLRVIVTLDGAEIANLPFGESHTLRIVQGEAENTVRITDRAVYMEAANCHGQDCVRMGEVTRGNMETRSLGAFIICLPHRISVEVRD